jgi:hypothetical protein
MIKGFREAGDLAAMEGAADPNRAQNLLCPVIFNYRQALELQLKYLLMAYGPLSFIVILPAIPANQVMSLSKSIGCLVPTSRQRRSP